MHLLRHLLGLDNGNGMPYLFWSGFGSDIGEITIVGAVFRIAFKAKQQRERHHKQLKEHIDYKLSKLTEEDSK